jgi:hypothetical protein
MGSGGDFKHESSLPLKAQIVGNLLTAGSHLPLYKYGQINAIRSRKLAITLYLTTWMFLADTTTFPSQIEISYLRTRAMSHGLRSL